MNKKIFYSTHSFQLRSRALANTYLVVFTVFLFILVQDASKRTVFAQPATDTREVLLTVPIMKQPYKQCLVASVSMVLKYWGIEITPEAIAQDLAGLRFVSK